MLVALEIVRLPECRYTHVVATGQIVAQAIGPSNLELLLFSFAAVSFAPICLTVALVLSILRIVKGPERYPPNAAWMLAFIFAPPAMYAIWFFSMRTHPEWGCVVVAAGVLVESIALLLLELYQSAWCRRLRRQYDAGRRR